MSKELEKIECIKLYKKGYKGGCYFNSILMDIPCVDEVLEWLRKERGIHVSYTPHYYEGSICWHYMIFMIKEKSMWNVYDTELKGDFKLYDDWEYDSRVVSLDTIIEMI